MEFEDYNIIPCNNSFPNQPYFTDPNSLRKSFTNQDSLQNNSKTLSYQEICSFYQPQLNETQNSQCLTQPHYFLDEQYQQKDESQEENKVVALKEKQIKKKKNLLKQKKVKLVGIQVKFNYDDSIRFFNGLSISSDGVIRFQYSVGQVSFGFNTHNVHQVSYQKNNEMIEIIKSQPSEFDKVSLEEALRFLARTPCKMYEEASTALRQFSKLRDQIYNSVYSITMDDSLIIQKDEEMSLFLEKSQEFIQEYTDKNVSEIFSYGIGRLNFSKRDIEVRNVGYSKSFLDLVGIDVDSFSSILLRQQKIDLIQDKDEILRQSIFGLNQRLLNGKKIKMTYNITTFDGFPLKISTMKKLRTLPNFQYNQLTDIPCEYIFQITTIDIDLQELQNLIQYRERLLYNKNQLSFDDFIKKELSYLFENVEYSVLSQNFIEKYYSENLINLHQLEQKKQSQQQQQQQPVKKTKTQRKPCGFSQIDSMNSNPIEVVINS